MILLILIMFSRNWREKDADIVFVQQLEEMVKNQAQH